MHRLVCSALAIAALGFGSAQARTIYTYDMDPNAPRSGGAGTIQSLSAQFDTLDHLSFSATLGIRSGQPAANGGWFVLSPGTMPRRSENELAIFYMDFAGGDLYAYRYNGLNNSASWRDTDRYITTYEDVLSVERTGDSVSVTLDDLAIGDVQNAVGGDWTGAAFGEAFGGWIHFTALDEFSVENGLITAFDAGRQSWLDIANRPTTVPEPAGLAALGLFGVLGAAAWRRRRG